MTHKSFLFSLRVFRWSISAYFVSRGDFSHSLSMKPTAPFRYNLSTLATDTMPWLISFSLDHYAHVASNHAL